MRVLIRCDASPALGIGHLMRCVALAERTPAALFAMACGADIATARGFASETISGDPAEFRRLAQQWQPAWIVVDVAGGDDVIAACAGLPASILRIDDAGLATPSGAALVVNPNAGITRADYPQDDAGGLLLGPSYALLRRELGKAERQANSPPRLCVSFGGSDPPNVTQRAVAALAAVPGLAIDAIVGPANVNTTALATAAAGHPNITIHIDPPDLGRLMASCDLALTAASGTMWELMAVGTPVIAVAIVDGQKRNLNWIAANGAGMALGWHADVTDAAIADVVRDCLNDPGLRHRMASQGRDLVDGCGADRVLSKMRSVTKARSTT